MPGETKSNAPIISDVHSRVSAIVASAVDVVILVTMHGRKTKTLHIRNLRKIEAQIKHNFHLKASQYALSYYASNVCRKSDGAGSNFESEIFGFAAELYFHKKGGPCTAVSPRIDAEIDSDDDD